MSMSLRGFPLLVALAIPGCQSLDAVLESRERGEGTAKVYPVSFAKAWDLTRTLLREVKVDPIEEHRDEGYMLTSTTSFFITHGCYIGVWIQAAGAHSSKVTVITRRKVAMNLVTGLSESEFHFRLGEKVDRMKGRAETVKP